MNENKGMSVIKSFVNKIDLNKRKKAMALQIRRFQEERDRWEIEREDLQGQADAAAAERDALFEVSF